MENRENNTLLHIQPDVRGLFLLDHTFGVEAFPDSLGSRLSAFSIPPPVRIHWMLYICYLLYIKRLTLLQSTSFLRVKLFHSLPQVPPFRKLFILSDCRQRSFFKLFQHESFPKPPKGARGHSCFPSSFSVCVYPLSARQKAAREEQRCPLEGTGVS